MREAVREAIGRGMEPGSLALLFAGGPKAMSWDIDYPFFPNRNFYYATGWERPDGVLALVRRAAGTEARLFIQRPSSHMQMHFGDMPGKDEAAQMTGISQVYYLDELEEQVFRLFSRENFSRAYLDLPRMRFGESGIEHHWAGKLKEFAPDVPVQAIGACIADLRRFKTGEEIALIEQAVDMTAAGIEAIAQALAPGRYEYEIEAAFDCAIKCKGAQGCAFPTITAGGKNSQFIHYAGRSARLEEGDLLLLDLGAQACHYAADISRTLPVSGRFTPEQSYFYQAVLEAQQRLIEDYIRPGADHRATVDAARSSLAPYLQRKGLIVGEGEAARYLPHGVCHHLGLDTHDPGCMDVLEPGMVITCEPGLYLPEYGFGIRIEDDLLVTDSGCRVLSAQIPKELRAVEELVEKNRQAPDC